MVIIYDKEVIMNYYDKIRNCKDLSLLFELWKDKAPTEITYRKDKEEINGIIDHKKNCFIADGIVNETVWNFSEKKRILFVLKEAYGSDWGENTLASWLKTLHPTVSIWPTVAKWVYGLQNTTKTYIPRYVDKLTPQQHNECLEQIAVLNIKKSNGDTGSVHDEICKYAEYDREEIKKEIELIDPDIVVCGNTFGILYEIVYEQEPLRGDAASDNWYYYKNLDGKERLYLDVYHPSNRWPELMNYYTVTNIYQQALIEKSAQDV